MHRKPITQVWQLLRKNMLTVVMVIFAALMIFSPDAKAFVLRQLMVTGLFNASISDRADQPANHMSVDFAFTDHQGQIRNTASFRGKVVFINFWATWCPPCRAEFPSIEALYAKYKNNPDFVFLTINEDDDPAAASAYLHRKGYSVPFYQAHVSKEIFSGTLPTTVILDKTGKIRLRHEGLAKYDSEKFTRQLEALLEE